MHASNDRAAIFIDGVALANGTWEGGSPPASITSKRARTDGRRHLRKTSTSHRAHACRARSIMSGGHRRDHHAAATAVRRKSKTERERKTGRAKLVHARRLRSVLRNGDRRSPASRGTRPHESNHGLSADFRLARESSDASSDESSLARSLGRARRDETERYKVPNPDPHQIICREIKTPTSRSRTGRSGPSSKFTRSANSNSSPARGSGSRFDSVRSTI